MGLMMGSMAFARTAGFDEGRLLLSLPRSFLYGE
jgi:hypothetical protein